MLDDIVPKYRVRLFLSVDLSGSTAFKNKQTNPRAWVPKFEEFYSEFKGIFAARFAAVCKSNTNLCKDFEVEIPKLWKTVGDELIFVNRVDSYAQVITYVSAFRDAMDTYATQKLKNDDLDVKGNGWLASFPYPNQTINVHYKPSEMVTEEIEKKADESPHSYEFLGSGIDSGFRIAKNSTPSFFTISPSLARIICMGNRNKDTLGKLGEFDVVFAGVNQLKGVINGDDFPIIGINTERDASRNELNKRITEISGATTCNQDALTTYLKEFETYHSVNSPALKLSGADDAADLPDYYTNTFLKSWTDAYHNNTQDNEGIDESSKETNGTEPTADELASIEAMLKKDNS